MRKKEEEEEDIVCNGKSKSIAAAVTLNNKTERQRGSSYSSPIGQLLGGILCYRKSRQTSKKGKKTFEFLNASLFEPKRKETWSTSWGSNETRRRRKKKTRQFLQQQDKAQATRISVRKSCLILLATKREVGAVSSENDKQTKQRLHFLF
jgi:hypothetical protein